MQSPVQWTPHRINSVDTLDGLAFVFRRQKMHGHVNPPDYQNALLLPHLSAGLRRQLSIAGIDLTRFQRACECAHHSTGGSGDYVVDGRRMRFLDALARHLIVLRDRSVDTENDRVGLAWKMSDAQWADLAFDLDVRNVHDFRHGLPPGCIRSISMILVLNILYISQLDMSGGSCKRLCRRNLRDRGNTWGPVRPVEREQIAPLHPSTRKRFSSK